MKALLIICSCFGVTCSTLKKPDGNTNPEKSTSAPTDSIMVSKVPDCIDSIINIFRTEKVQNPPRKIYRYTYNNKTVYYVQAICCDFFSDLYDDKCNLLGHPDGGFTGKGDGSMPDFHTQRKNEELVWQDKRK